MDNLVTGKPRGIAPGLSVSRYHPDTRTEVLAWQFILVPSSCLFYRARLRSIYEWCRLWPGSGRAPFVQAQIIHLQPLWTTRVSQVRPERLSLVCEDYFRRKRCARMAASSGLTGWASWPRRLTGGMLPNWRFARKLLASWIVFFSSANRSCWRM